MRRDAYAQHLGRLITVSYRLYCCCYPDVRDPDHYAAMTADMSDWLEDGCLDLTSPIAELAAEWRLDNPVEADCIV